MRWFKQRHAVYMDGRNISVVMVTTYAPKDLGVFRTNAKQAWQKFIQHPFCSPKSIEKTYQSAQMTIFLT